MAPSPLDLQCPEEDPVKKTNCPLSRILISRLDGSSKTLMFLLKLSRLYYIYSTVLGSVEIESCDSCLGEK